MDSDSRESEEQYRQISESELATILEDQSLWVETNGVNGSPADLSNADLRPHAETLSRATLRGADLGGSNLAGAALSGADWQEINLNSANLEEAALARANLQGALFAAARLRGASLRQANLEQAKFLQTSLQNASLSEANLKGAVLTMSDVHGADFTRTNLRGAILTQVANLAEATLQDCNMEEATGLRGTEFARADITGADLPMEIRGFGVLKTVEETSKNARKIFAAMLLGCVYSWLTIATTTDVQLLTNAASTPLPIIQTPVPTALFYVIAPFLLLGSYLYMHLYLQRLWKGLSGLPAIFEDGKPLDQRAYPWLLNGLVRRHFYLLKDNRTLIHRMEEWVSIALVWYFVPFTLFCFWLRFIPRHDGAGSAIHVALIVLSVIAGWGFYRAHVTTLRGRLVAPFKWHKFWLHKRTYRFVPVLVLAVLLGVVSDGAVNGVRWVDSSQHAWHRVEVPRLFSWLDYDVFADFGGRKLSEKPEEFWKLDFTQLKQAIKGANLRRMHLSYAFAQNAYLANADLTGARLNSADFSFSKLPNAKLDSAILHSAIMTSCDLEDASFVGADLRNASLVRARLRIARFNGADLTGADLSGADMGVVRGLTQEQLDCACGDSLTKLPWPMTVEPCPGTEVPGSDSTRTDGAE